MVALAAEGGSEMAYREKLAWLALVTLLPYALYFAFVPSNLERSPRALLLGLGWFAAVSIARAALFGAGAWVLTWRTPAADRVAPDERDRAIRNRAAAIAYGVMMTGFVIVGIVMPFARQGWHIVNAALAAILVSEAIRHGATIFSYRRGWHG
jgi:uncharacterized membrane protein